MKLDRQRLWEAIRADDREGAAAIDRLIAELPGYVMATDKTGDIDSALLEGFGIDRVNRFMIPVEYGGSALTATALRRTLVFERIGAICPGLCIGLPGPGLSMPPVLSLGTEDQRRAFFARFIGAGRPVWGAFAISEPAIGSDATALTTTATADGEDYLINGEKCFITNGGRSDVIVVFASVDRKRGRFGIRAFMVDATTPGFAHVRNEDMLGLRGSQLAQLSFTDCRVHKTAMLGHDGSKGPTIDAFTGAQSAWDYMRPVLTSVIIGSCAGALEYAGSLLAGPERDSLSLSGRAAAADKLGSYRQRLQAARMLAYRAAWRYDRGERASLDASMAKAYASTLAMQLAQDLMQLFPLQALAADGRLAKFYRDAKAYDILEGTGDMQRLMIARAYDFAGRRTA